MVDEGRKLIPPEKSAEESRGKKLIAALRRDFDRFKKGDAVIRQEMQRLLEVHRGTGVPIVDGVVMSSSRTRSDLHRPAVDRNPRAGSQLLFDQARQNQKQGAIWENDPCRDRSHEQCPGSISIEKNCIQAFETTFFAGINSLEKKQIYQITI